MVAGMQAEVRSGRGRAAAHLRVPGAAPFALRVVRWKEGAVATVRQARLRASWAAAMATLLAARRSRGWRMGAAAAAETGARIGGARAAGSGSSQYAAFAAVRRSRKSGGFGAHGALAAARRSHQRWRRGRALHRRTGGQGSVTTGRGRPPDSANRRSQPSKHARFCGASAVFSGETGLSASMWWRKHADTQRCRLMR